MNVVVVSGNLVRDPELKNVGESKVVSFSVAVNTVRGSGDNRREDTSYVDCEAWGRQAEVIAQYMKKGDPILVNGELRQDRWEDTDGNKRSKIKVNVSRFDFMSKGKNASNLAETPSSEQAGVEVGEGIPF